MWSATITTCHRVLTEAHNLDDQAAVAWYDQATIRLCSLGFQPFATLATETDKRWHGARHVAGQHNELVTVALWRTA